MLRFNGIKNLKDLVGRYFRVGFYSKISMIKSKPITHFCFSLQLVTDYNELTKFRLEVIKDYCKSKFD